MLRPFLSDTPMRDIASDVLTLTKMNWNSTQFDGGLPIPLRAARQVGRVLRHVPIGQQDPGLGCRGRRALVFRRFVGARRGAPSTGRRTGWHARGRHPGRRCAGMPRLSRTAAP